VVVDTEEGVISQLMGGPLQELFSTKQLIHGVSGAGNNWAHGYGEYGPMYRSEIFGKLRKEAEAADSLQCFLLFHSLGGGTGSGLGSFIVSELADLYPKTFRFAASVFPSRNDDVITSPYNAMLALNQLTAHADCVFPVDNSSLLNICAGSGKKGTGDRYAQPAKEASENQDFGSLLRRQASPEPDKKGGLAKDPEAVEKKKVHAKMNSIIAHLLSDLTCSMRFEGKLNVDLNEITMNLVPFPKLHFLMASMAPLQPLLGRAQPRNLNELFSEILLPENQIVSCNPREGKYLAMGLILRGAVEPSDVSFNIERIKKGVQLVSWNKDGFKYGICDFPPVHSVL
jgi:tubulin epsilon